MIYSFDGQYRFLSNFWPAEIEVNGLVFPTVETAYQAAKLSLDMPDRVAQQRAFTTMQPGEAKRVGKTCRLRADWNAVKIAIMTRLVAIKFARSTPLARRLQDTNPHELIEGNTWGDTFWGVCNGRGRNELGQTLMLQRTYLLA